MYYRNATDNNCVESLQQFFDGLQPMECVTVGFSQGSSFSDRGVGREFITLVNAKLSSSEAMKSSGDFVTEVHYTIPFESGDITASASNNGKKVSFVQKTDTASISGRSSKDIAFRIQRSKKTPVKGIDFNITYKWVRTESKKVFEYRSANSAWDFVLMSIWEGKTKEEAESSTVRYEIEIRSVHSKTDTKYQVFSVLEKILDVSSWTCNLRQFIEFV